MVNVVFFIFLCIWRHLIIEKYFNIEGGFCWNKIGSSLYCEGGGGILLLKTIWKIEIKIVE